MAERKDLVVGDVDVVRTTSRGDRCGAQAMMEDGLWDRVVKPDFAMAFHVTSALPPEAYRRLCLRLTLVLTRLTY